MNIPNGLMHKFYRHKISNKLYNVIGVGKLTSNPTKYVVIYHQMYNNINLKNNSTILPIGSIWVRDIFEFNDKMEPCEIKNKD